MEDVEIDSVMVVARSLETRRALERRGAEVYQHMGRVVDTRGNVVKWSSWLMKVPYPAAVRLGILPPAPAQPAKTPPARRQQTTKTKTTPAATSAPKRRRGAA